MVKVLYRKKDASVSVLVNMATNDGDGAETFDRLNALVVRFLHRPLGYMGMIPFDKQVGSSVRRQSAMSIAHPHSAFASRIRQTGVMLCGLPVAQKENFFSRLLKKL
jgi:MinD-like ATPase involved in chromosome partitioning or flagellar assembly